MKKNCLRCNKEFTKKYNYSQKYWLTQKYCSISCSKGFPTINVKCLNCKKEFKTEQNRIKHGRGKNCSKKCYRIYSRTFRGEKHWAWKGGGTERKRAMGQVEYVLWRTAVFMRDDYTCQTCAIKGGNLEADHIKPWALYPELRYAIDNGRTLCRPCHLKTDTFGRKAMQGGTI